LKFNHENIVRLLEAFEFTFPKIKGPISFKPQGNYFVMIQELCDGKVSNIIILIAGDCRNILILHRTTRFFFIRYCVIFLI